MSRTERLRTIVVVGLQPGPRVVGAGPGFKEAIHVEGSNLAGPSIKRGASTRASGISVRRSHLPVMIAQVGTGRDLKERSTLEAGIELTLQ